jgi:hypothetical protein
VLRSLPFIALIATACVGGQTGEITELAACHEPADTAAIDEPSEAGRSAAEQLDALTLELDGTLVWHEGERAPVSVSFALSGDPATLLDGPECERPWLEAPVVVTVRTSDGTLDETIEGTVLLADNGSASVLARIPVRELAGTLDLSARSDLDPETAVLRADLLAEPDALGGRLSLSSGADGTDEPLASF